MHSAKNAKKMIFYRFYFVIWEINSIFAVANERKL